MISFITHNIDFSNPAERITPRFAALDLAELLKSFRSRNHDTCSPKVYMTLHGILWGCPWPDRGEGSGHPMLQTADPHGNLGSGLLRRLKGLQNRRRATNPRHQPALFTQKKLFNIILFQRYPKMFNLFLRSGHFDSIDLEILSVLAQRRWDYLFAAQ